MLAMRSQQYAIDRPTNFSNISSNVACTPSSLIIRENVVRYERYEFAINEHTVTIKMTRSIFLPLGITVHACQYNHPASVRCLASIHILSKDGR
jgi:hypothetical protein